MFETIWRKKENLKYFDSPEGKLAFIENDKGFFCLGGHTGLNSFLKSSVCQDKPVCGYYVDATTAESLKTSFNTKEMGKSYKVLLSDFSFKSPYINRIKNYAKRNNYQFSYLKNISSREFSEIKILEEESLKSKRLPAIGFLMSKAHQGHTEWGVVRKSGRLVAALGFNKINESTYYLDNIISVKERFSTDFTLLSAMELFTSQNIRLVDLGMVPFQGIDSKSNIFYWGQYFNWLYSSKGLAYFKKTYATNIEPVYGYFDKRSNLSRQFYQLAKLHFTN